MKDWRTKCTEAFTKKYGHNKLLGTKKPLKTVRSAIQLENVDELCMYWILYNNNFVIGTFTSNLSLEGFNKLYYSVILTTKSETYISIILITS